MIQRILKIRRERERERGEDQSTKKFPKTRFYEGSSEHQVVKGATRLRGEKRRNICEVKVHREQRRDLGRKKRLVLDFFKSSCDCEKFFLVRKI